MALTLTWLGHSTVVIDLDGTRLLTDPLLKRHVGPLRRRFPKPDPDQWRDPDAVLISHTHTDHTELGSLRMLPGVPVLTAHANARWLRRRHIPGGAGIGHEWAPVASDVGVRLVDAIHHHRPMPHRPNATNGHLIRGGSATVYAVGDTSLYGGMADVPVHLGRRLDVILVPIAGWGPRLSPGHMGPKEAAIACSRTGARYALPVHWGTLHPPIVDKWDRGWIDRPLEEFIEAMAPLAPETELVRLMPGESWTLPG